jgi:uncharacterized protein (TIGR02246 family)
MNVTRFTESLGVVLSCLLAVASGAGHSKPESRPQADSPNDEILATIGEYVAAYNRHDAAGLAGKWTENGMYEDGQSGECLPARKAIRRDFSSLLSERNDLSLNTRVDRIRFIRPDVAEVTGHAVTASPHELPCESQFRAVLVREGGRWLIDSITESLLPAAGEPYDRLRDLEFLVGQWLDDTADARVTTTGRWSANRSFLVRSYAVERGDGSTHQGSQIIGWDPRQERIRCWMFDSGGSFGEGTWTQSQDGWIVKYSQILADGRRAGGTQVISRVDDETLSIQSFGQEIGGVTLPASKPIRVVRIDAPGPACLGPASGP